MVCSYQCPYQLQLLPGHLQAKGYWISLDLQKLNFLKKILIAPGMIWTLILEAKKREVPLYGITNTNIKKNLLAISCHLFFWKEQIINNHHKIINLHGVSPPKVWGIFSEKCFSWGNNIFLSEKCMGRLF